MEIPVLPSFKPALSEDGSPMILTKREIRKTIEEIRAIHGHTIEYEVYSQDGEYVVVDHEWMLELIKWWDNLKYTMDIKYLKQGFDCDNFAAFLSIVADFSNQSVQAEILIGSVSVFQHNKFGFVPAGNKHALNFFVSDRGIFILEPQGPRSSISELEKYPNLKSIYFIKFNWQIYFMCKDTAHDY